LGNEEETEYATLHVNEFRTSQMKNYPNNYKFTGVIFDASSTREVTQRETYDLLLAAGDIGGVNEIIFLFMTFLVSGFSRVSLKSKLAKHLYS